MSTRTVEQIDSWDTVPFSGGYSGLQDLADSDFSGAVITGPARLFMLNGKVVGILDGSIEDFEDASGTAREAPHPGLPLLAVMQERSDEVRAKYYTEDTPVDDVDQTLSSGGFTGYVELSENVLSGDYYQIYHQGRSMSVAWVGNSDELLTEDEAFERTRGEVGIYEVRPVDIEIIDIPSPESTTASADEGAAADESASEPGDSDDAHQSTGTDTGGSQPSSQEEHDTERQPEGAGASQSAGDHTDQPPATTGTDPVAKTGGKTAGRQSAETERADESATDSATERTASTADEREATETVDRDEDRTDPETESSGSERRSEPDQRREPARRQDSDQPPDSSGSRTDRAATPQSDRSSTAQPAETRGAPARSGQRASEPAGGVDVTAAPHDPSAGGAADLETRSIPSLAPSRSETASTSDSGDEPSPPREPSATTQPSSETESRRDRQQPERRSSPDGTEPQRAERGQSRPPSRDSSETEHPGAPAESQTGQDTQSQPTADTQPRRSEPAQPEPSSQSERVEELETDLEESEAERERLEAELDTVTDERNDLQAELEEARTEIERLEQRIEELATEDDDTPAAETRLSQREAIDQTNLFVRYDSKGDATLEAIHSGNAERSAVDDNLRLEYHTQFDAATAAVGDQQFEAFLTESIQYRFVDWLVRNLLYEIRDTGNPDSMGELYDALPKIDRAELNGNVTVEYAEDGEQHRSQEQFDVVVRDRMGNPLIVANINNSRDPATDDMMTDLIKRAERVGSSSESLAGAFLVTESFFEPPALETAEEATSSGLLSRDKRKSFVNLSRKDGYHLCLVEARNQEFHLAVPEL